MSGDEGQCSTLDLVADGAAQAVGMEVHPADGDAADGVDGGAAVAAGDVNSFRGEDGAVVGGVDFVAGEELGVFRVVSAGFVCCLDTTR